MLTTIRSKFITGFIMFVILFTLGSNSGITAYAADLETVSSSATNVDLKKLYSDANTISPWAYTAIGEATELGFVQGSNGKFNPKSTITRAEFTKILATILDLELKTSTVITFTDVTPSDWFYSYVNAAYKEGLVTGSNNKFNPNDKMNREQMASTIVRALGIQSAKPTATIKDMNKVSSWAKKDVETIVAYELMQGSDNQFKPLDSVTREMAAVMATRAYEYKQTIKPEDDAVSDVDRHIKQTAAFLQNAITDPVIATVGGEWTLIGLSRSDVKVPEAYYTKYYTNVEKTLKEKSGKLHNVKYTEYDRVILALTSLGKDIHDVAGYDLSLPLADYSTLIKQGINGPIFALIALDSNHYEIPVVAGVKTQTTRELLVNYILEREITGGGWALGEAATEPDADITAMVLQGLTPYYDTNSKVKAAVDRGITWLSIAQSADGGYSNGGSASSESIAQVIVALAGLGINPQTDTRFVKDGHSLVNALLSFAAQDGGFYHLKSGGVDNGGGKPGEVDLMATDQAMNALVAYNRLLKGQTRLYDMTDMK